MKKKITLLFAVLLALMGGVNKAKAETLTENFNALTVSGSALSNGWLVQGATLGTQGNSSSDWGSYSYELASRDEDGTSGKSLVAAYGSQSGYVIIPTEVTGTISFRIAGTKTFNGSYSIYAVSESEGSYTIGTKLTSGSVTKKSDSRSSFGTWTTISYTYNSHSMIALMFDKAAIDNFSADVYEIITGPALLVKDGTVKISTDYSYNFGLATEGTTKTFTLSNPGTENLTVSVSETGNFNAALSATTIAAGGEVTLTITMPEATGSSTVTITPTAESGIEPFKFNVSGTIKDSNKVFVDFANGQLPDDWSNVMIGSSGSGWEFNTGYASHSNSASSYYLAALTSPMLKFAENENLFFDVARYGTSTYSTSMVKVQTSADGSTWTDLYTTPDAELVYGEWKTQSVAMPAGNYYIRFYGGYAHITNIYGGELPIVANMKVKASDHNFGLITEAASTTFTIANSGRATLEGITVTSDNTAFTITGAPESIDAGADAVTVTVTMSVAAKGAQSGTITIKATGFETVSFNVSGYVADTDAYTVSFDALPEGWENTGWSFGSGYATGAYTASTTNHNSEMISPAITVGKGETLAIEAQGTSNYAELKVYTSTDNGVTWTLAKDFSSDARANTTAFSVIVVDNVAAGSYKLKLEGYAVCVRSLNGYSLDQNAPALAVTPAENFAAGKVTLNATKTYTVANTGTGELTVNIVSSNDDFTVSPAQLVVTNEPKTFTVTFNYNVESLGEKSATITVTPTYDESAKVTINASATAKDPNVWEEDFEDDIPATWTNNGWTIGRNISEDNSVKHAYSGTSNNNKLTTPRLEAAKDAVLEFTVIDAETNYPLTIEYATERDGEYTTYGTVTETGTATFVAPLEGTNYYYIRFSGRYIYLDDFSGFKLALPDHDLSISDSNIPATGNQYVAYTATVTVKESVGKEEAVKAELFIAGEAVATKTATVVANGTETISLNFTPEEPITDGEAKIVVTYAETLTTSTAAVTLNIAAAPVFDETVAPTDITTGNNQTIKIKYTAKDGWNTIAMPFALTSDILNSIFGAGWKAYEFSSYNDGELGFKSTTAFYAGYPYIVYVEKANGSNDLKLTVNVPAASANSDTYGSACFRGTYAPIAAGAWTKNADTDNIYGVTPAGKIAKAGAKATINGFRGYFDIPASASVKAITFDGGEDGIRSFSMDSKEMQDLFDLNGRKVNNAKKGVFIQNGKKVVVK